MSYRLIGSFVFSAALAAAGYFILQSDIQATDTGDALARLGKALFYGAGALASVFLILSFVPSAFSAWKRFAIWFVPFAALLFALYPYPGSGDFMSPYPTQVIRWVSALFVAISIAITAKVYFSKR